MFFYINKQGYMTKRAIVSGRNWKKRYFVLLSDGTLQYKKAPQDEDIKNSVVLSTKSKALVLKELAAEGGIYIEGPTHDPLFLKAESTRDAKDWIKKINDLVKHLAEHEDKTRKNHLEVFSKKASSRAGGGSVRTGAKEKRTPAPPLGGWEMRIGAGKTAKDVFVDANTWMYYADHAAFDKGAKALGKADLASLV
jgi:hypothetical protein